MYLMAGKQPSRLMDRWFEGLCLGVQDRSDEVLIGTRDGVVKARTVRRLDDVQRRDASLVREMRGTPWEPVPGDPAEDAAVPVAVVPLGQAAMVAELPLGVGVRAPGAARNLYVRRTDIDRFGATVGCPGCIALAVGGRSATHSAQCRARIAEALEGGGDGQRVDEARRRKQAAGAPVRDQGAAGSTAP